MNGVPNPDKLQPPSPDDVRLLTERVDRRIDADPNRLEPEVEQTVAKSIAIIAMLRLGVEQGIISQDKLDEQAATEIRRILSWISLESEISLEALRRKIARDGSL
jgi:hypothetical protein